MTTLFVRHDIGDYAKWKRVYHALGPVRKEKGVTAASVHREVGHPHTVVITHRFNNAHSAQEFANSEELKTAMDKAGVISKPEFWFAEDVEVTPY